MNLTHRRTVRIISSLALIWVLASLIVGSYFMVAATPYRTDTTPASRNLTYQDIELVSDGIVLEGWWIPAERPVAELIFVHGAGSNRISRYIGSLDFYRTLNEMNVSVITMDLRNHGNSAPTDEVLHMGVREWPDVVAAAHWLDLYQPSDLPRFILGASMGGSAAIHALHHGLAANGLILLDPQLDILDSLKQGAEVSTGLPALLFALAARIAIWRYDLPQGEFSPLNLGESLELPILLLQDWDDPVTRSRFANLLAQRNSHVQLQRVPEIDANAPCLRNKGAWGSHVAAHPCHPRWTRVTIEKFIEKTVNTSPARSSGSPPLS